MHIPNSGQLINPVNHKPIDPSHVSKNQDYSTMKKPLLYAFLTIFLLSGCDNHVEDAIDDIAINVCASGPSSVQGGDTSSPIVGSASLSSTQAFDASIFPERKHLTPSTSFGFGARIVGASASEFRSPLARSVYAWIRIPDLPFDVVQLQSISKHWSGRLSKTSQNAKTDSVDMFIRMFMLEEPGVTYPDTVSIAFEASGSLDTLHLVTDKHMITLENQVYLSGNDFNYLPEYSGVKIHVSSSNADTTNSVVSIIEDYEVNGRHDEFSGIYNINPVRNEMSTTRCAASYYEDWQFKMIDATKVRFFLLENSIDFE